MSRYTDHFNGVDIAWGYDEPLQEYFIQAIKVPDNDEDEEETLFWIGSHMTIVPHPLFPDKTTYSNGDILTLIDQDPVLREIIPVGHKDQIAMDLKF